MNSRSFFDTTTAWYDQIRQWPTGALTKFVKAGDKIRKFLASAVERRFF